MDAQDFATFYPRLAAELRQIEVEAMPSWVATPRGLRPARAVLPEAMFATAVLASVTVWLILGLLRWGWAGWWWILVAATGWGAVRGLGTTARCVRKLARYRRGHRR
jgi:hypothetical protein